MGEVYPSEEKTEPFSQSEIDRRIKSSLYVEDCGVVEDDSVPLDDLVVEDEHRQQGVRLLVRPLTRSGSVSPGSENCEWLALRADGASVTAPSAASTPAPEVVSVPTPGIAHDIPPIEDASLQGSSQNRVRVLAVTQTSRDINFSLRLPSESFTDEIRPPVWCELYYDPASDNQILLNRSDVPITIARISQSGNHIDATTSRRSSGDFEEEIVPGTTKELVPGSWRISVYGTPVLDFRILAKRPATLWVPNVDYSTRPSLINSNDVLNSSKRGRSFSPAAEEDISSKRLHVENEATDATDDTDGNDSDIMFYPRPTLNEVTVVNGQPLLQIQKDETVTIPGGRELDYQITKRGQIATTTASTVYTAEHSDVPDGVITVKVLKTRSNNPNVRPQDSHRNVIRQADIWLREYRSQADLKHKSIVTLYGGDARYLSLYMEHVDGKDLAARGVWRDAVTDLFLGDRSDAIRILKDISGALNYVHQRRRVHNDIKPANILFSRDRGAVLCDFGLSNRTNDVATNGGTPYYVPPEFIGHKLRGTPSDVWALGVTMLYVLKRIAFPDARGRQGHPKQLYWLIAEVNRRHIQSRTPAPPAVNQMHQWLNEVNEAKARLNKQDKLHMLVSQMLTPNPGQRITMAKVMNELHVTFEK